MNLRAIHSIRALDFQSNGLQPKIWTTFRCRALARAMPTIAFMEPGAWPRHRRAVHDARLTVHWERDSCNYSRLQVFWAVTLTGIQPGAAPARPRTLDVKRSGNYPRYQKQEKLLGIEEPDTVAELRFSTTSATWQRLAELTRRSRGG
ncbi:uncharacterized protein BO96DRAFT_433100 [Aspergillus niger CBS 101883]|uniref:Uncharacterized protein n=2 Tax=Aspergillus niger TaxID=5061 RepID=A2QNS7_ASPNC|nr:uncharacterized protein BO96DRAFT_433100 [Aspergillus niger CBS 101883]XP_059600985.1 hypothetical protein An07g06850 [Aspergillus niger]PYH57642.1 hypothetical protein BO96DRAFT_433100 [Aspergillus niger CBS 101883]CAK39529.1 hypothetical protein An07g06850 [Aspergillus niger]